MRRRILMSNPPSPEMKDVMKVIPFRNSQQPTVLCVDDEAAALQLHRLVLEKAGFNVFTAATANDAMRIVRAQRLDLVLTDYYLDGVTGASWLER